jgi:hypothetical protein
MASAPLGAPARAAKEFVVGQKREAGLFQKETPA